VAGLQLPVEPLFARSNWQSYCVRVADPAIQTPVMQALLDDGVSTRRGVMCSHREQPYADASAALRQSEMAQDTGIILPLHHMMTAADMTRVAESLRRAVERLQPVGRA
jgi:dTDP-4-amino-4,6-dideoxygalactose transaminase